MRVVIQRVSEASVSAEGDAVGAIGRGLLVYVGIGRDDGPDDVAFVAGKIRNLRIFQDEAGRMNLDVCQVRGQVLLVSNFTLLANLHHGRRPAFTAAAAPETAQCLCDELEVRLRGLGVPVATGRFGAMMSVTATNDGPINVLLDSKRAF
jgi:D-tyrosyl-tRNA(Tyr) deacylase